MAVLNYGGRPPMPVEVDESRVDLRLLNVVRRLQDNIGYAILKKNMVRGPSGYVSNKNRDIQWQWSAKIGFLSFKKGGKIWI